MPIVTLQMIKNYLFIDFFFILDTQVFLAAHPLHRNSPRASSPDHWTDAFS